MPSARGLRIGTAEAKPGEVTYDHLDVPDHPNGIPERLPVIVAQGHEDGPTLWLTANIHLLKYPSERLALLAVRDDAPLIALYPGD